MTNPARRLLGGHAFDTLTKEEKQELYRAALDDQELFDALVEDEALRDALADPGVRRELLGVLERPTLVERVRAWLRQPATLAHLSVATAVMFVAFAGWVLVGPHPLKRVTAEGPAATGPGTSASDLRAALFALPPHLAGPARVEGEAPSFTLMVIKAARVLAVEKKPDGRLEQLFPAPGHSSGIAPGEPIRVTGGREPGVHRVRFLVCPPDLEPLSLDSRALAAVRTRLTVIERVYEIGEGGAVR
jgi:hypothetical protein